MLASSDYADSSVGACIAQLAAHLPTDKVITIGNNEMIELAKKWKAANGQA